MDNLTHALSGALIARLTASSPQPGVTIPLGRRVALGMLAASVPDLDFVLGWLPPAAYLLYHRGVTHSFLLLPIWSFLFAWLCAKLWRGGPRWRAYFGVFAWGIGIHIVGDWITAFGTMFLAPLSDRRFALSTTFIIDLWLLLFLLAGTVGCFVWRSSRVPAAAALCAAVGYIAFQGWQHGIAIDFGERYARAAGLGDARVSALPRPVSPFNWTVMVEDAERIHRADVRLTEGPALLARLGAPFIERLAAPYARRDDAQWSRTERFGGGGTAPTVRAALATPELAYFRWFADHPVLYRIDRGNPSTCIWFEDLRFVTPGREVVRTHAQLDSTRARAESAGQSASGCHRAYSAAARRRA
jgi:inner membrane protein